MGLALNGLRSFAAQLGPRRMTMMGVVAAVMLLVLGFIAMRGPSQEMGYLYTDLDPAGAQSITQKLTAQNIPFQISADGTAIMAPRERLAELRMSMASEQLGGKIGYEVLDQEEPFGVSSSRAKMNETRAIEGELSRSIESLDRVTKARVHIVMPERAMFAEESRKATAAITLKTQGTLGAQAIEAMRYLVSSSVPELSPDAVSIVDQTGALLARAGDGGGAGGADIEQRQAAIEGKLRDHIEAIVEPVVGQGKARVEVAAVIERDQTREEANVFDPDKQVVAHQISVEAADQNSENDSGARAATVSAQLPESQGLPTGTDGDKRQSAKKETSEDTTYDNSRTHSVTVRSPGKINRLTVAVLVDGGPKGLPPAQITRITRLVENAVGFDPERGDSVVVDSIAFAAPAEEGGAADWFAGLPYDRLWDLAKLALIAGVGLVAMRMLRQRRSTDPLAAELTALPAPTVLPLTAAVPGNEGGDEAALRIDSAQGANPALLDQEIALAQVDGRVKMSAIKRIGDAVAGSPGESASVIRQWMNT
jgi:flagellar M-ring protein FliF